MQKDDHSGIGHRERLKRRFTRNQLRSLSDYEILELSLFYIFKRKDTKALAKALLKHCKSLPDVFFADATELQQIPGVGPAVTMYFRVLADLFSRCCLPVDRKNVHIVNNWVSVLQYCRLIMGLQKTESFRGLFIGRNGNIIADELIEKGTIDKVSAYPREIARLALVYSASAVLIVHNHPSGKATPSQDDILITNQIEDALESIEVALYDHLIVTSQEYFSFRMHNLLKSYSSIPNREPVQRATSSEDIESSLS